MGNLTPELWQIHEETRELAARYGQLFESADPKQSGETVSRRRFVAAALGTAGIALAAGTASAASRQPVQCELDGRRYDVGDTACIDNIIHECRSDGTWGDTGEKC